MKNIVLLLPFLLLLIGCSSRGYDIAKHNKKMYYFPENCYYYEFTSQDPDTLFCTHKGKRTGYVLKPATVEKVKDTKSENSYGDYNLSKRLQNDDYNQIMRGNDYHKMRYGY